MSNPSYLVFFLLLKLNSLNCVSGLCFDARTFGTLKFLEMAVLSGLAKMEGVFIVTPTWLPKRRSVWLNIDGVCFFYEYRLKQGFYEVDLIKLGATICDLFIAVPRTDEDWRTKFKDDFMSFFWIILPWLFASLLFITYFFGTLGFYLKKSEFFSNFGVNGSFCFPRLISSKHSLFFSSNSENFDYFCLAVDLNLMLFISNVSHRLFISIYYIYIFI